MVLLKELPALVVLERFPVPVLAIAEDGSILFANAAFGEMLGYPADVVKALKFPHAELIVELLHRDGSIVRARMSKSALLRGNDPVALATFQDLTERLWADEL
jgi:PAS domain-containing protein